MRNYSIAGLAARYLLAVAFGAMIALGLGPVTQHASRFVTIPPLAERVLDSTQLGWRPLDGSVTPCGILTYSIDDSAAEIDGMIHTAMTELGRLAGRTFVPVDDATDAFIVFGIADSVDAGDGRRALGVAETSSRWVGGTAVIDHTRIKLSREGMRHFPLDYSPVGFGWTVLHEAAHAIGVEHIDDPGSLMAPVRDRYSAVTAEDARAIAVSGSRCR